MNQFVNNMGFLVANMYEEEIKIKEKSSKKTYDFDHLSDYDLLKEDKEILKDPEKRIENSIRRSIRIALSKKIFNVKLITIIGKRDEYLYFGTVVEYEKNGIKRVIDYEKDLVMKKEDYYDYYNIKEIQILKQAELYYLVGLYRQTEAKINILFISLFGKEILKEKNFKRNKYDEDGINSNNIVTFSDDFIRLDLFDYDCQKDLDIQDFTENPSILREHITKSDSSECYFYDQIQFALLSDNVDGKSKKILLSDQRYGHCHENALNLILNTKVNSLRLVSGKIKVNGKETVYHTWVEDDYFVYDFNRNIIMKKEDYYALVEASVINISSIELIKENLNLLLDYGIHIPIKALVYLNQEINRDLIKQKYLLKKRKN